MTTRKINYLSKTVLFLSFFLVAIAAFYLLTDIAVATKCSGGCSNDPVTGVLIVEWTPNLNPISSCSLGLPQHRITWDDDSQTVGSPNDMIEYRVLRCEGAGCIASTQIGPVFTDNNSPQYTYLDNSLSPFVTYGYRVEGTNPGGFILSDHRYLTAKDDCAPRSVDIKANKPGDPPSDGPITIPYDSPAIVSWTSNRVDSCSVSPCPPGAGGTCTDLNNTGKSTNDLTSSQTYTLSCLYDSFAPGDLTTAGNTISSGLFRCGFCGGWPANRAFDNNLSTEARSVPGIAGFYAFLGQDFGTAKNISYVRIWYQTRGTIDSFRAKLQYSDDGTSWSDTNITNIPTPGQDLVWKGYTVNDFGAHRYWRFQNSGFTTSWFQVSEIEMLERAVAPPLTDSVTVNVAAAPNNAPVANATISTDGANYSDLVTVMQGVPTRIYLAASSAAGVSTDPDGWSDVTDNGKCEWNADLNQGAPTFEAPQTVNNPASASSCNKSNVQLDVYDGNPDGFLTFNDAPGLKTYQVLRINDGTGDSNVDTVQVNVTAQPPPTVDMVARSDPGGSYSDGPIYVNYGGTATLKWCKPSPVSSPPIACAYAVSCTASGAWSGAKSPSGGTQSTGPLTAPATYTLTCLNSLGVSRPDSVQIRIPDFTLSANPPTIFATIKGSGSVTSSNSVISVTPLNGFNSTVSFSATLPPGLAGATANFSPTSLSSPYSSGSTFNVTVPANIAEGVYTITISGSGGGLPARTTTVTLNVAIKDPGFRETLRPVFEALASASL